MRLSTTLVAGPAIVAGLVSVTAVSGQSLSGRTPWGDPDLQGTWTSDDGRSVPLQRPAEFGTRRLLTDEEYAERARRDDETRGDTQAGVGTFVGEVGTRSLRATSLIVDPPDGQLPALTEEAQQRAAAARASQAGRGPADSWEDRTMMERCISRGVLGIFPSLYGNGLRIVQTPGLVAINYEMIHETRIIRLTEPGADPGGPPAIRSYMGTPRGWWDGETLVVETTNFTNRLAVARTDTSEAMRLRERFTRVANDRIDYEVTITDPDTWVKPWTVLLPLTSQPGYQVFPFECHEGNYAIRNILQGARQEEALYEEAIRNGLPPPEPPSREAEAGILPRDPSFGRPRE